MPSPRRSTGGDPLGAIHMGAISFDAVKQIGLAKIEAECAFFAAWLAQIRELAQP